MKLSAATVPASLLVLFTSYASGQEGTNYLQSLFGGKSEEGDAKSSKTISDVFEGPCFNGTDALANQIYEYLPQFTAEEICTKEGDTAMCDASILDYGNYTMKCDELGGQMFQFRFDECYPLGNPYFLNATRLIFTEFRFCAAQVCEKTEFLNIWNEFSIMNGISCPKEKKKSEFALMRNDNGKLITKKCGWLEEKSQEKRFEICFEKKFQLYAKGRLMPASRACQRTCKPDYYQGLCVQESNKAKFFLKKSKMAGAGTEETRSCKWLQEKSDEKRENICMDSYDIGYDTKYGKAYEVCTDTCRSCGSA